MLFPIEVQAKASLEGRHAYPPSWYLHRISHSIEFTCEQLSSSGCIPLHCRLRHRDVASWKKHCQRVLPKELVPEKEASNSECVSQSALPSRDSGLLPLQSDPALRDICINGWKQLSNKTPVTQCWPSRRSNRSQSYGAVACC